MVEVFFSIITRHAIRRGTFRSVRDLTSAIVRFIDAYDQRRRRTDCQNQTVKELGTRDTRHSPLGWFPQAKAIGVQIGSGRACRIGRPESPDQP